MTFYNLRSIQINYHIKKVTGAYWSSSGVATLLKCYNCDYKMIKNKDNYVQRSVAVWKYKNKGKLNESN